jgi:hypothetical protein
MEQVDGDFNGKKTFVVDRVRAMTLFDCATGTLRCDHSVAHKQHRQRRQTKNHHGLRRQGGAAKPPSSAREITEIRKFFARTKAALKRPHSKRFARTDRFRTRKACYFI